MTRSRAAGSLFSLMKAPASAALPAPVSGAAVAKEGFHFFRACIGEEQSDLGALAQLLLARPLRIGEAESLDRFGGGVVVAVAILEPGGELARGDILDARDRGMRAGVVASIARAERSLEIGRVGCAELVVEQGREDLWRRLNWRQASAVPASRAEPEPRARGPACGPRERRRRVL